MKIGQVTMFGDNYGACLQAFALQKVLKNKGAEVELIDYHQSSRNCTATKSTLNKVLALGVKNTIKYLSQRKYIQIRKLAFSKFRKEYLSFGAKTIYRNDDFTSLNSTYDKFICGSDMIWSEEFSDDWDYYFLSFADKQKSYAYAPSFGKNQLTAENKEKVKLFLKHMNKISCREDGGVELLNSLGFNNAKQVLDPTLLLTREEWEKQIPEKNRIFKEDYFFTYLFGTEDVGRRDFFKALSLKRIPIYRIPRTNKKEQKSFPISGIGPIEYLRLFRDASFIVTDTFHGLLFSIIFRKPFLVLSRNDGSKWAKYSDRMTSTLKMLGMTDRYVDSDFRNFNQALVMDYSEYESILNKKREESLQYIDEILKESE